MEQIVKEEQTKDARERGEEKEAAKNTTADTMEGS